MMSMVMRVCSIGIGSMAWRLVLVLAKPSCWLFRDNRLVVDRFCTRRHASYQAKNNQDEVVINIAPYTQSYMCRTQI